MLLPPLSKNQPLGSVGVASAQSPRAPLSLGVPQEARSYSLPCVPIVGSYTPDGSSLTPSAMGWITSSFSLVICDCRPPEPKRILVSGSELFEVTDPFKNLMKAMDVLARKMGTGVSPPPTHKCHIPLQAHLGACYISLLHFTVSTLKPREKGLAHGHKTSEWQNQDHDPGVLTPGKWKFCFQRQLCLPQSLPAKARPFIYSTRIFLGGSLGVFMTLASN